MTKIAINGFGRIGRLFFRLAYDTEGIEIAAVNDLGDAETLAYLLERDTVYGRYGEKVEVKKENLVVGGKEIKCLREKDPSKLPWKKLGIDVVVEATGVFTDYEEAKAHIKAGARKVVVTAPSDGREGVDGTTVLMGVNEESFGKCDISSNGSCTTNAAAPLIKILDEKLGIEKAVLNTVHGYTASQNLVDGPTSSSKARRGRAAAQNIVPSSTGAAKAVSKAIPKMEGKFDGIALRVPVIVGSVADITFVSKKDTSVEEVNEILKKAAKDPRWEGIFTVTEEPIVSSDIIGEPYGAIADLSFTRVVGGNLVKVLSWYDNEFGYAATLLKHVKRTAGTL